MLSITRPDKSHLRRWTMVTPPSISFRLFGHDLDTIIPHSGTGRDIGRRFPAVA
jgi:hypothetical protein